LNKELTVDILKKIGCKKVTLLSDNKIRASCPLAPFLHKKGTDRNPSCGFIANDEGPTGYHCFTCNSKGTLVSLLYELHGFGKDLSFSFIEEVKRKETFSPLNKIRNYKDKWSKVSANRNLFEEKEVEWEKELENYKGVVHKYIIERGIKREICERWELGYDKEKKRVIFPIRSMKGGLVGAISRTVLPDVEPPYLTHLNFKKSHYLYGEQFLVPKNKSTLSESLDYGLPGQEGVLLVEGTMDALWLSQMGYDNVVSLMTATISEKQAKKLLQIGRPVYLLLDWDIAGIQGRKSVIKQLFEKVLLFDVPSIQSCSCGCNWNKVVRKNSGGYEQRCVNCNSLWVLDYEKKDPGGLSEEEVFSCIKNARRIKKGLTG